MPYFIVPLSKFRHYESKDERTAYLFASLYKLDVIKSVCPSKAVVVISLDRPLTDSVLYEEQPLGIGA